MSNTTIYQYHNDKLCVCGSGVIKTGENTSGIIHIDLWGKWIKTGATLVQKGGNGRASLIEFDTIPLKYKTLLIEKYGDPKKEAVTTPFKDKIKPDPKAAAYYSNYILADGRTLKPEVQREYTMNAAVLEAIGDIYRNMSTARKALGGSMRNFWQKAAIAIENVKVDLNHSISANHMVMKRQYKNYFEKGYEGLISGKYCNQNTRKVSNDLEKLFMALYTMPNRPFAKDVHDMYTEFLAGKIEVADTKTGEILNPNDYKKSGFPLTVSKTTVWNYLNQPQNRAIVDKKRNDSHAYNNMHRPHHHRNAPNYSFSKITMDDRDLPRKLADGNRVKAYYAYDVTSGCVIGAAYSRKKDEELFLDCLVDMFRLIEKQNWGMPMEVEVENHLVNKFFDDLGAMFPFLRICAPGNSQEKHAEHLNRAKKYEVEKKNHRDIGRWWARSEAYRVNTSKVNDEFIEKSYTYERLVADDLNDIKTFNNNLHKKQKKYPNKTRWNVLCENMNPELQQVSKSVVYKCIGQRTHTSIRRNQYVSVQHAKYQLPNPQIMDRLLPNNYDVDAYYLPSEDGSISEVYLYQQGQYLCKCDKLITYNTSQAEQTEDDASARTTQVKYVAQFDKLTKDGKEELAHAIIIKTEKTDELIEDAETVIVETTEPEIQEEINESDYYDSLIEKYTQKANEEL